MQAAHENDLNFAAFALAILNPYTVEQAFDALELKITPKQVKLTGIDFEDILKMRDQGIPWLEIADMYGANHSSLCRRTKQYKEKKRVGQNI